MALVPGEVAEPGATNMARMEHEVLATYGIPTARVHQFTTARRFANIVEKAYQTFPSAEVAGYLAFCGVGAADLDVIDKIWKKKKRMPGRHLSYHEESRVLIVKMGISAFYVMATGLFHFVFNPLGIMMGLPGRYFYSGGSCRFGGNGRQIVGDAVWTPTTRRILDWPSVALEVGVFDNMGALRSDAEFWIANSGGRTRVVLLLAINRVKRSLVLERWGHVPTTRPGPRVAAAEATYRPRMIQSITYEEKQNHVEGTLPLLFPANLIYDVVPNGLDPADIQLTRDDLTTIFQKYWQRLREKKQD